MIENIEQKISFLEKEFTAKIKNIPADKSPLWGKMNPQQMVEHMSEYVGIASGKNQHAIVTAEDILPKMQAFLASEKPFRENTPNALMPDTPPEVRHTSMGDAIMELQSEINYFFEVYNNNSSLKVDNPFFGKLDFQMQVQLLYKHATHHLRQFAAL